MISHTVSKVFQKKSEIVMFASGLCILASVLMVALTESFIFWNFAKIFYALGVILVVFNK